jgi:hypothetical protein
MKSATVTQESGKLFDEICLKVVFGYPREFLALTTTAITFQNFGLCVDFEFICCEWCVPEILAFLTCLVRVPSALTSPPAKVALDFGQGLVFSVALILVLFGIACLIFG